MGEDMDLAEMQRLANEAAGRFLAAPMTSVSVGDDLVERLQAEITPERREEILSKGWDPARAQIQKGSKSDFPRLLAESWMMDTKDELIEEAADRIIAVEAERDAWKLTAEYEAGEEQAAVYLGRVLQEHHDYKARATKAEARIAVLESAIDAIADFNPDGPISPDAVGLIRIAGAARRAALTPEPS